MAGRSKPAASGLAVALFLTLIPSATAVVSKTMGNITFECPDGWNLEGPDCYLLVDAALPMNAATELCMKYGSSLVQIRDEVEAMTVGGMVQTHGGSGWDHYWIGNVVDASTQCGGLWAAGQPRNVSAPPARVAADTPMGRWTGQDEAARLPSVCRSEACVQGTFRCRDGKKCLSNNWMCDGEFDCDDQSDESNCAAHNTEYLRQSTGTLTKNQGYAAGKTYMWTIEGTDPAVPLSITFSSLNVEPDLDYVEVWSGGPSLAASTLRERLTGSLSNKKVYGVNNFLIVRLVADLSNQLPGFVATWAPDAELSMMDRPVAVTDVWQDVTSPYVDSSPAPRDYTRKYTLTAPQGSLITMEVTVNELGSGFQYDSKDFNAIGDPSILPAFFVSRSNSVTFYLETGASDDTKKFKARVKKGCSAEFRRANGYVTAPGSPYPPSVTCSYTVRTPQDPQGAFQLNFTNLSLADEKDSVTVYDGANSSATQLSYTAGTPFLSSGSVVFVEFTSSLVETNGFFALSYDLACPALTQTSNMGVSSDSTNFGAVLTLNCSTGFAFEQEELVQQTEVVMECGAGGQWNVSRLPTCATIYCGIPVTPQNGFIEAGNGGASYDATVTYSCYDGFTLDGTNVSTCGVMSSWSATPTCQASICPALVNLTDGSYDIVIGSGTDFGTIANYSCNSGFDLIGSESSLCQTNGSWSHPPPICQRIQCPIPEIDSATLNPVSGLVDFESSLDVQCSSGLQINASTGQPSTRKTYPCLASGSFGVSKDLCIDIDECVGELGTTNPCTAANQKCVNAFGSANCECEEKYKENASGACEPINRCALNTSGCDSRHGECVPSADQTDYTCRCQEGYVLFSQDGLSGRNVSALETGTTPGDVLYLNHTCVPVQCAAPAALTNGGLLTNKMMFDFEETAEYRCNFGYNLVGQSRVTCNSTGTWDMGPPSCQAQLCDAMQPTGLVRDVYPNSTSSPGDTVMLECYSESLERNYNKTLFCAYDNDTDSFKLQGDAPICPAIDCGSVNLRGGASFNITESGLGASFTFGCVDTYRLEGVSAQGNSTVVCQKNGRWGLGNLTCSGERCTDPGTPGGMEQEESANFELNGMVKYRCLRPGFVPEPAALTCTVINNNTQWDSALPVCKDNTKPTFSHCPQATINVKLYGSASDVAAMPIATDNSGMALLSVEPAWFMWNGTLPEGKLEVTYTASDADNNTAVCNVTIQVSDPASPPTLTCPGNLTLEVTNLTARTVDLHNYVTSDSNVTFSFSSGPLTTVSPATRGKTAVRVTATDSVGLQQQCAFMLDIKAAVCIEEDLKVGNATEPVCSETAAGVSFSCSVTCLPGFTFSDGSPHKNYSCSQANQWSPKLPASPCLRETNAEYLYTHEIYYSAMNLLSYMDCLETTVKTQISSSATTAGICTYFQNPDLTFNVSSYNAIEINPARFKVTISLAVTTENVDSSTITGCDTSMQNPVKIAALYHVGTSCPPVTITIDTTESTYLSSGRSCIPGLVLVNDKCVPCGPGTKYANNTYCEECPDGYYQDLVGQDECKACPNGATFSSDPRVSAEQCVASCEMGFFNGQNYTASPGTCTACPVDYYLDASYTADCIPCPAGKTTYGVEGAANAAACLDKCAAGSFPVNSTECAPCPLGFYKSAVANTVCTACEANQTTASTGSVAQSDCVDVTPVVCQNGGVALIDDHRSVCTCGFGYTGNLCDSDVNACLSNPCYNGATCTSTGPNTYQCTCPFNAECRMMKRQIDYISTTTYENNVDENTCKQNCLDAPSCTAIHHFDGGASGQGCRLIYKPTAELTNVTGDNPDITSFIKDCSEDPLFNGSRCETDLVQDCSNVSCADRSFCRDLINKTDCVCPGDSKFQAPRCTIDTTVCDPSPCDNGATCVDSGSGVRATCVCPPGYTGENCETNIDECAANPDGCLYQGVCTDGVDKYTCTSCGDYTGDRCEGTPDFCSLYPTFCQNGLCVNDYNISSAVCSCDFPFRLGSNGRCEEIPLCSERNPCSNNATCERVGPGKTRCQCPDGYGGTLCQHDINDCADNTTCARGDCVDMVNGFMCRCPKGYNGTRCDNDIDECLTNTCVDNATERCQDRVNGFTCICKPGFTGSNCQTDIDECASLPCRHNGTCAQSATPGQYNCSCVDGWTGPNCESLNQFCSADTCESRGECYSLQSDYFCSCVGGSSGKNCKTFTDLCNVLNPCMSPSTCKFDGGQATCQCPTNYAGSSCNLREDSCSAKPCLNGGTCKPGALGYTCDCATAEGHSGENCSTSASPCDTAGCPTTATCTVLDGKALCLCPAGKIRSDSICKDMNNNFDIYFAKKGDAIRSTQPFTLTKREMTLMFYFAPLEDFGNSNVVELRLSNGTSILSVNNASVTLGGQEVTLEDVLMGKWNHISITRGSASYELVLNGVQVETNSLVPDADFPPLNEPVFVYVGGAFTGYVSQVTVWQRSVSYSDVLTLYDNSRATPTGYSTDLVARWSHYRLFDNLLASVTAPSSYAKSRVVCPGGAATCTGPPPTKSLPAVTNCPNDTDNAPPRVLQINDLFNGENMLSNMDDTRVTYGVHRLVFMSQDSQNNVAFCRFNAYVRRTLPSGVQQSCSVMGGLTVPTAGSCGDGSRGLAVNCAGNKRAPLSPNILSCGMLGSYNLQNPDLFTDAVVCGDVSPLKYKITLTLKYKLGISCGAGEETRLKQELKDRVKALQAVWSDLCPDSACNNADTDAVKCNGSGGLVGATVVLSQVPATLTNGSWTLSAKELLQTATLDFSPSAFDMSGVFNGQLQTGEVVIVAEPSCQAGYGLHDDVCVECAAGSFLDAATGMCQLCAIGTFSSAPGNSVCTPCGSGKTTFQRGATSCDADDCAAGQRYGLSGPCGACAKNFYSNATGQLFCKPCPADKATETSGANTVDLCFSTCAPGTQLNGSECSPCPRGMYNDGVTTENCTACAAGKTTQGERTVSETMCNQAACDPGHFRNNVTNTCEACDYGYYQPERWQDQCLMCDPGYTTANNASTDVSMCQFVCGAGTENLNVSGTACTPCQRGFYRDGDLASRFQNCSACNSTFTTPGEGSLSAHNCSIKICEAGNYRNESENECHPCPEGQYQPDSLQTSCLTCPVNRTTRASGSDNITQCLFFCAAGYEVTSPEMCGACDRGKYKSNDGLAKFGPCLSCNSPANPSQNTTDDVASTSVGDCSIPVCVAGQIIGSGGECEDCPADTHQSAILPRMSTVCTPCPAGTGTMQPKSDASSDCKPICGAGQQYNSSSASCEACPMGAFNTGNDTQRFQQCQACPEGYTTAGERTGATSGSDCTLRDCPAGSKIEGANCTLCPVGTYQPLPRQTDCTGCRVNTNTSTEGNDEAGDCTIECDAGNEQTPGTENCQPCVEDFVKEVRGPGKCLQCTGNQTASADRTVCDVLFCDAGFQFNVTGGGSCDPCAVGKYKAERGKATQCVACPTNTTTAGVASTASAQCDQANCDRGFYSSSGSLPCLACPIGSFKSDIGNAACTRCSGNFTTASEASTFISDCSVVVCPIGQFRTAQNECQKCAVGTYQNETGTDSCVACPAGFNTTTDEANSMDECKIVCAVGSFRNDTVSTVTCQPCPVGQYQDSMGQMSCTACPATYTTAAASSNSSTDCFVVCPAGQFGTSRETCQPCPHGQYQSTADSNSCMSCAADFTTLQTGSTQADQCMPLCMAGQFLNKTSRSCVDCSLGTYNPLTGTNTTAVTACTPCPAGNTTTTTGATVASNCSILDCEAGQFRSPNGGCQNCAIGSYQPEKSQTSCINCDGGLTTLKDGRFNNDSCVLTCPNGQQYQLESATCEVCPIGFYRDADKTVTCVKCKTGETTVTTGQAACTADATPTNPTPIRTTITIRVTFRVLPCLEAVFNLQHLGNVVMDVIMRIMLALDTRFPEVCKNRCDNVQITFVGAACLSGFTRAKRATPSENQTVQIELKDVPDSVKENVGDQVTIGTADAVRAAFYDTQPEAQTLSANNIVFMGVQNVSSSTVCLPGSQQVNQLCVACPAGQYSSTGSACVACPVNTYQGSTGQTACVACPAMTYTTATGSTNVTVCKQKCSEPNSDQTYCSGRGKCVFDTGSANGVLCQCQDNYGGASCTARQVASDDKTSMIGGIVGGACAFLLLLLIIFAVVAYLRRAARRGKKVAESNGRADRTRLQRLDDSGSDAYVDYNYPLAYDQRSGYMAKPSIMYMNPAMDYEPRDFYQSDRSEAPPSRERSRSYETAWQDV